MSNNIEGTRKEELMRYVKLLEGMERAGFHCKNEIKEAMSELHEMMLPAKEKVSIAVLERGVNIADTISFYLDILGKSAKVRNARIFKENSNERGITNHIDIKSDKVNVYIFCEGQELPKYFFPEKPVNYIINNTNNFHLPEELGLKTV